MAEWSLTLNLKDVPPAGLGITVLPEGAYAGKILSAEMREGKGSSIDFEVQVKDGASAGESVHIYPGTNTEKVGNQKNWKSILMSIGANEEKINKDGIQVSGKTFVGKDCFFYVKHVEGTDDQGRNKLPDIKFVTPKQFKTLQAKPAGATATGQQRSVAAVNGGAGVEVVPAAVVGGEVKEALGDLF